MANRYNAGCNLTNRLQKFIINEVKKFFGFGYKPVDSITTLKRDSIWEKLFESTPTGKLFDWIKAFEEHGIDAVIKELEKEEKKNGK